MRTISVQQLAEQQQQGTVEIIDVRTPVEFRQVHVVGARNAPLGSFEPKELMAGRRGQPDDPLFVICHSGGRSSKAVQQLMDAGFDCVTNVEGGTSSWDKAGLPVERGQTAISLERQVRILAGFLTLLGAVLGYFLHPAFIGLSAFIGAGLMFAGITDTCGMGMMLAKMPWNQCGSNQPTAACNIKS